MVEYTVFFTSLVDYKLDREALRRSLRDQLDQLGLEIVPTNMPIQTSYWKRQSNL